MKLFKKILLGLGLLVLVSGTIKVSDGITWLRTNQVEKMSVLRITSNQITNGDSIVFYQGQTALLKDMCIKHVPYASGYNTDGSTDTVKIYSTYNGNPVQIGYILDTIYGGNIPTVSYTTANVGTVDGTIYWLDIPSGKFSGGDAFQDAYFNWTIIK